MRSYRQYCAMAKALDLVGDRWTLLIVRELLLRGPCRYTDLKEGLPGIATNLLADRLRELGAADIVRREAAPPPIATTLFSLTELGEGLEPVLRELGRWGVPMMVGPSEQDEFRSHWLAFPVSLYLSDQDPAQPPVAIELRTGGEPMTLETIDGSVRARPGAAEDPDLVLSGPPQLILGALSRKLDLTDAQARGLGVGGNPEVLRRVQRPDAEGPQPPTVAAEGSQLGASS